MFKLLFNFIHALAFYLGVTFTKLKGWWRPRTKQHRKVSITKMALKAGDSYRLGECIVTLAQFGPAGKQEVAAKIAAIDKMRALREKELEQKAVEIMLMTPEQLAQFQVDEWLKQRKQFNEKKIYDSMSNLMEDYKKAGT